MSNEHNVLASLLTLLVERGEAVPMPSPPGEEPMVEWVVRLEPHEWEQIESAHEALSHGAGR